MIEVLDETLGIIALFMYIVFSYLLFCLDKVKQELLFSEQGLGIKCFAYKHSTSRLRDKNIIVLIDGSFSL